MMAGGEHRLGRGAWFRGALRGLLLAAALLLATVPAAASTHWHGEGGGRGRHVAGLREARSHARPRGTSQRATSTSASPHATRHRATGVLRDHRGHVKRDREKRAAFMRSHPCPSTGKRHGACPGYQVDHRRALACGGTDNPANMQWLSVRQHRAKHAHGAGCTVR